MLFTCWLVAAMFKITLFTRDGLDVVCILLCGHIDCTGVSCPHLCTSAVLSDYLSKIIIAATFTIIYDTLVKWLMVNCQKSFSWCLKVTNFAKIFYPLMHWSFMTNKMTFPSGFIFTLFAFIQFPIMHCFLVSGHIFLPFSLIFTFNSA